MSIPHLQRLRASIPEPILLPLGAAGVALSFIVGRFVHGNPLSSGGGDLVYVHHLARLRVAEAWQDLLNGNASLIEFIQLIDGEFPPFLHISTLLLGSIFGHGAEIAILSGLLWLLLLAISIGWLSSTLAGVTSVKLAPARRCHRQAGSLAAAVVLLMGSYQGFTLRYYYDLPMTALLWAGLASVTLFWDKRPLVAGFVAGTTVAAAALTKWTALPFAAAMAVGLVATTAGLPSTRQVRWNRLASLAVASAVSALLCGTWLHFVDEGENQSSLSVMGGTFQSRSGTVIKTSSIKAGLDALREDEQPRFELLWTSPQMGHTADLYNGDIDGDGDTELAVYDHDGRVRLYRRESAWGSSRDKIGLAETWRAPILRPVGPPFFDWLGNGTLQPTTSSDPNLANFLRQGRPPPDPNGEELAGYRHTPPSYAAGDVDGDGDLDLAVGLDGDSLAILLNEGGRLNKKASWRIDEPMSFGALAFGDWNGDGDLDLAVALDDAPNRVYDNREGSFELVWKSTESDQSKAVAWGDWDGDGDLDLAVGNSQNEPNRLYENSAGSLQLGWTSPAADSTVDLAWADWDGDGDEDLAFGNLDGPNRIYTSIGGGPDLLWTSPVADPTRSISWHDWDGDGRPDLVVGNEGRNPERVYRNLGPEPQAQPTKAASTLLPESTTNGARATEDAGRKAASRLRFYPHWLVRSIFPPPLALVLIVLALVWVVWVRTGMALLLCTVLGQWLFLLTTVPPLDERFVITLAPALVIAASMGWSRLPTSIRSPLRILVLCIAFLTAFDFHYLDLPELPENHDSQRWTRDRVSLHSASYADGGWKRGQDERALIQTGTVFSWHEARSFYEDIWDAVERCQANTVLIASTESPIDDSDWWKYRVALAGVNEGLDRGMRPAVAVVRGGDAEKQNYLSEALQPTGVADLALSLPVETVAGQPPPGILEGTMEIVEVLKEGARSPAVNIWRPLGAKACAKP